jgi:hypothetical protein
MIKCGGCGREIDPVGMPDGARFLCTRCCHLHTKGPEPPHKLGYTAFTVIAYLCLAALALAGFTLCVLYVIGAGDLTWFVILSALMLCVAGCPAVILVRKRNLALLLAALYLPLGVWAHLWHRAPGVEWEYSAMTAYGGYFFLLIGAAALVAFISNSRALPRL